MASRLDKVFIRFSGGGFLPAATAFAFSASTSAGRSLPQRPPYKSCALTRTHKEDKLC